jgi:hypothetical protein
MSNNIHYGHKRVNITLRPLKRGGEKFCDSWIISIGGEKGKQVLAICNGQRGLYLDIPIKISQKKLREICTNPVRKGVEGK